MSSRRHKAREIVLQMLYQKDLNPEVGIDTIRQMIQDDLRDEHLSRFAWSLFTGVMEFRLALDKRIEEAASNWSLSRMAPTDRNVLRLGGFELLHTETPPRVVIDEVLELAKSFGGPQSGAFVNGILDKLIPFSKGESRTNTGPQAETAADLGLDTDHGDEVPEEEFSDETLDDSEADEVDAELPESEVRNIDEV